MNQEKQEPSQIMIDTFISKFQNQDQRIADQEGKIVQLEKDVKAVPDLTMVEDALHGICTDGIHQAAGELHVAE